MRAACRARGGAADVWIVKVTLEAVTIMSRWLGEELSRAIRHSSVVFDALSMRGRREEWGKRRAMLGLRVLREGDGFRILRRRRFRLSRLGRDRLTCRDRISCRAIS
ncbi:hypothetical protein Taro_054966 [Colocasia esculenta]|uniref:Uncharacterized protein n=1 Tax=Colocasia esculenta TaxID=4460 RepID=A0A843XQ87_COLES|nr:hypothetical protein [Colocasia esculenta]